MSDMKKPTYEELVRAIVVLDRGWANVASQTGEEKIDFTVLNNAREATHSITKACKSMVFPASEPEVPSLQNYLKNFDEYSFTDLFLRDLINSEERRQSKNCSVVQSREEIEKTVREDMSGWHSPIDLAVMIVQALSYAAKGETE